MQTNNIYRLLTRSDLDGLVCAVLLRHLGMVKETVLIDSPGDMSAGRVKVDKKDIIANLPFVPGAHLCFDHHVSETIRNRPTPGYIIDPDAPSAARVVYEYYGGTDRFPPFFDEIMEAVDKADTGSFSQNEILRPEGWAFLNFLVDKRTRIEEWGTFSVDEFSFKKNLIEMMGKMPIEDIMNTPDVRQRTEVYRQYEQEYRNQLVKTVRIHENVAVFDFRRCQWIYPGNRFVIYALYPDCNVSVQIKREKNGKTTTLSVGKSIINKTSGVNIGELMYAYGGGGHRAAGACHVKNDLAEQVFSEILEKLTGDV